MDALTELHATATGAKHRLVKTKKPQLIKDLERNQKSLVDRKKKAKINANMYPDKNRAIVAGLVEYINGKDEQEAKKRKHQEDKEAKKKARATTQLMKELDELQGPTKLRELYALFHRTAFRVLLNPR